MSKNMEVAALLEEIASLLEFQDVAFKPVAYRRAAQNVAAHREDIAKVAKEGRLHEVPGVGASIAEKISTYIEKGKLPYLEKLRKETPGDLSDLMGLPGLGPKKIAALNKALGVGTMADLEKAARAGKIRDLEGFGARSELEIIAALERRAAAPSRHPRARGLEAAARFLAVIQDTGKAREASYAGSLRRGRDTVGDLDLLVSAAHEDAAVIMDAFVKSTSVKDIIAHGAKKSSIRLHDGFQVDLRVVSPDEYGAALLYFTGSKAHNLALRKRALGYGWTLNEYALTRKKDEKVLASESEEEIYAKLKLPFIPPEIREDLGEIDAAKKDKLPRLVEPEDVIADLHTHTTESDGHHGAEEMIARAAGNGLKVYGVSDHSKGLGIAHGLDQARYRKQRKELDSLQEENPEIRILQGAEVNIDKNGSLDLTRAERAELDYVIGSIHSAFTKSEKEQTRRILKAIDEGIDIWGHPTGRKIGRRDPVRFDEEKVFAACAENGVLIEIDGALPRLDLPGELVRKAKEHGCRFVIDSDAHDLNELDNIAHGVTQARRGWLEAKDVASTLPANELERLLGRAKRA